VAGEGVLIQYVLYLLAQTVEGFTHVGGAGDQPDTGARREEIIVPSRSVREAVFSG
jgi:hypothetical protein